LLPKHKITVLLAILIIFIIFSAALSPALAAENDDEKDDLEWRMDLIEASRSMMEEEQEIDIHYHRVGTSITTFPDDGATVNAGLSLTPHLTDLAEDGAALRGRAELFYLRERDDFAGFLSLIFALREDIYLGVGGEVMDAADYQVFTGWEPVDNFFLEIRAVNTEGDIWDSEIHPAAGFQMKF